MALNTKIWGKLESFLLKNSYFEAINLLEDELHNLEKADELADCARRLSQLYQRPEVQNVRKAAQYAALACHAYCKLGRVGPAVALLNILKKMEASPEIIQKLQRRIGDNFSRPSGKPKKTADDHLPPPTPYKEMRATVTFDNDEEVLQRIQWEPGPVEKQKVPLFSWLKSSEVSEVVHLANLRSLSPGSTLFKEGDASSAFYIVAEGEMQMNSQAGVEKIFKEGDCFGELALLGKMKRTATLKSKEGAQLLEFSAEALQECFERLPQLELKVLHFYEQRLFIQSALRHPLFSGLSSEELEQLWDELTAIRVPAGRVLFESPGVADRFYLLTRGKIVGMNGTQEAIKWSAGRFLGATSALSRIEVREESYLLECHKLVLEAYFQKAPQLARAFSIDDPYDFFIDEKTHEDILD